MPAFSQDTDSEFLLMDSIPALFIPVPLDKPKEMSDSPLISSVPTLS